MGRTTVYNNIVDEEKLSLVDKRNRDLASDFLDYLVSVDRSKNTIDAYRHDLNIFFIWNLDYNDNKFFVDLSKRDIVRFQKFGMTEWGWSTNRLARVKSTLSSMSNYVYNILDDELPNFKPIVRRVESPKKSLRRDKTIITDEEVDMVLDTLVKDKKYRQACAFALAAFGGARKSELLRYKVSYFDDENKMEGAELYKTPEKIQTKGQGSMGKPLYKYTLLDFKKYLDLWMQERQENNTPENEYIFCDLKTGITSTTTTLDSFSDTITKILGKPFYFHALRHQLCTRLCKIGLPSSVIQEYFGWSSASMINIYSDLEVSESFGEYFTSDGIKANSNNNLF